MEDMEYWECRRKEIERCMWNAYREILDEYSNLIFSKLCAKNFNSRCYIWGNIYFRFTFTRTIFRLFNDFENCSLNSFQNKFKTVFSKQADLIATKPTKPLKNVSDRMSREPVRIVG